MLCFKWGKRVKCSNRTTRGPLVLRISCSWQETFLPYSAIFKSKATIRLTLRQHMFFVLRINVCSHILQGDNSFKILCQLFTRYNSDVVYPWPSVFFLHWKSHCVSKVLFFVLTVIGFHFLGIETWKTYYEEFFFKKGVAFRKGMELWWDMAY